MTSLQNRLNPQTLLGGLVPQSREHWINVVLVVGLVGAAVLAHFLGERFYINLASRIAIIAMAAVGLNLALGFGGMVSFGHAAFFGLGGYVAGIAAYHAFNMTPVLGIGFMPEGTTQMLSIWLVTLLVSGLLGLAIGKISLGTSGVYFIMITLAFAQMMYYFANSWPNYGGEDGLPIFLRNELPLVDTNHHLTFFFVAATLLLISLWISQRLMGSRFGAALTMARMNPVRLATSGIDPQPVKLVAFVISAMIAGLAGALYADLNRFVSPSMLSWHFSGELIVIVILGGVGRLYGPLAGAILFVLMETWLGGVTQHWQFWLGLVLLGVVLFARGGLMGFLAGRSKDV
ncbi:MAG: branched-chain amino acid ABC transporter permease [Natronospirillum sp.]|uniref:branched-chain amino acid ABC transporter permease n=1 Tax=Natronospirillum sp. TaxID=2812955 RepID=UPI0025FB33B9|nr:branched-chain amino acid ABC transporter permease [Natronospirillum sp.]MCH8550324.1 branched-chain amino acid ABC transporter permease [Natronospirillum sp.]